MKKIILNSGGYKSLMCLKEYYSRFGSDILSVNFYDSTGGACVFEKETAKFLSDNEISTMDIKIPIMGYCSSKSVSKVIIQKNLLFGTYGAIYAERFGANEIVFGVCSDDFETRDCREDFFRLLEFTIQAGRGSTILGHDSVRRDIHTGDDIFSYNINCNDVKVSTPYILKTRDEIIKSLIESGLIDGLHNK